MLGEKAEFTMGKTKIIARSVWFKKSLEMSFNMATLPPMHCRYMSPATFLCERIKVGNEYFRNVAATD
jgi:hypothetical protein